MEYILCLGDSLTYGARDEYLSSYPAELGRLFWERENKIIYCLNRGINGETSGELLRRIYHESKSCPQAKIALVWIGTNDTFLPQKPDIYQDNLRQIIAMLQQEQKDVGLGLLPPIIGPGSPNYPYDSQKQIDKFNEILILAAKEYNCFLADFRGLGKYIIDTVHFNHDGYCKIAEIWHLAIKERKLAC